MKELHLKVIKAYIEMLSIHIDTKTSDSEFHNKTEEFYKDLFEIAHKIGEKYIDLGGNLSDLSLDKKTQANIIIKNLREKIENYKDNNKISFGTEDLLGSITNNLEDIEGSSRAFLKWGLKHLKINLYFNLRIGQNLKFL